MTESGRGRGELGITEQTEDKGESVRGLRMLAVGDSCVWAILIVFYHPSGNGVEPPSGFALAFRSWLSLEVDGHLQAAGGTYPPPVLAQVLFGAMTFAGAGFLPCFEHFGNFVLPASPDKAGRQARLASGHRGGLKAACNGREGLADELFACIAAGRHVADSIRSGAVCKQSNDDITLIIRL